MKCPKCHTDNPDTSRFCGNCATSLTSVKAIPPSLTETLESPVRIVAPGTVYAGRYEILERIGAGGMGEVYRAVDKNLSRHVAIKILPAAFVEDEERTARFEREAKLLAVLNHPNIAAIHGLEESEGRKFLVLELAEGETLQSRLNRGPLPVEEALETCREIAEGLEAAHEKGIIHRDLKPGNIMITPEGKVKILDFGLAKAYGGDVTGVDIEKSPTITAQMTEPGVILGTAAYMSPEQARGRAVDRRVDIWAFGCVLYECLTGKRAFQEETLSDTLAHILKGEPDWSALPSVTPANIRTILRRCLQKDRKYRLHDIADARIEIDEAGSPAAEESSGARRVPLSRALLLAISLLFVGALIGVLVERSLQEPGTTQVIRATISLPAGTVLTESLEGPYRTEVALAPDGSSLIFSASPEGAAAPFGSTTSMLYLRPLDRAESTPIPGTEGARTPIFSPDGLWVAFWAKEKLCKLAVKGGIPDPLCDVRELPLGICWGPDGRIVFATVQSGLQSISADGSKPETLAKFDSSKEVPLRLPHLLPGGKGLVFTSMPYGGSIEPSIEVLSFRSGRREVIIPDGADARYLPTGHLAFVRKGALMAAPFDPRRLKITGPAVTLVSGLMQALNSASVSLDSGAGQYSFSNSGALAYASGGINQDVEMKYHWIDRDGRAEPWAAFGTRPAMGFRLSPDGQKGAFCTLGTNRSLWVYDIPRNAATKLTSDGLASFVNWTPDGKRVVFSWTKSGTPDIYWMPFDGSGIMECLARSEFGLYPGSWTRDGKFLALVEANPSNNDVVVLRMEDKKLIRFAAGNANESLPEFSPDGRWLAYTSDETGRSEVYVRSFPEGDGKVTISSDGGAAPVWAPDGRELFYWNLEYTALMKVDISTGQDFFPGVPKKLFDFVVGWSLPIRAFDITPDGRRFLIRELPTFHPAHIKQLNLVQNWFEELRRLVPSGKK